MIRVYDTLSETKKELSINDYQSEVLKLFVCGPTVYGSAHLGHARTEIVFDNIVRYLRSVGFKVFYLGNITDVDDKIIKRANEEKIRPLSLAKRVEKEYLREMRMLRIISVDKRIRASAHIKEIQNQIQKMLNRGFAYQISSGVYFEVRKFSRYGSLSKQNLEKLRHGWRIESDPQKKDPMDFVLWKLSSSPDNAVSWASPWGRGRPGWHIEDTAITEKFFGSQYDLHGGGVDLKFPHHESEIAQQESISDKTPFVKIWLHVGFLMMNGEKMAKSLGNFVTIGDFLRQHSVNTLRFIVAGSHYRSPINYDSHLVEKADGSLATIEEFIKKLDLIKTKGTASKKVSDRLHDDGERFVGAMNNDFNTPEALAVVFQLLDNYQEKIWEFNKAEAQLIKSFLTDKLDLFGISFRKTIIPKNIKDLIRKRESLRKERKFNDADLLRNKIKELGYDVEDTPAGPLITKFKN